jgi:hypothetical protein
VCKFHYNIWQIFKPAKGEEDLAASLEQAKKDFWLVIDGVDKLSSLFIRGDISLWVASVTNLIEKINAHTMVECGSDPMDRLPCELQGGLRHLGNQLSNWNNGTDPNRTNDINYSNGRIRVLNGLLKTWNDDYEKIFTDDLEEMIEVYSGLAGLAYVLQTLRASSVKWILDYNNGLGYIKDIGFGLNRINWGAIKDLIGKNPAGVGPLLTSVHLCLWNSFTSSFLLQDSLKQENPPSQGCSSWRTTSWSTPAGFNMSEANNLTVHLVALTEVLSYSIITGRPITEVIE